MINKDSSDEANPEDVVGRNRVDSTDFCLNCDLVIYNKMKFKISSDRIKNATGPNSKILFGKLPSAIYMLFTHPPSTNIIYFSSRFKLIKFIIN
jgi:hypothetical protein